MLACIRFNCQTTLIILTFALMALDMVAHALFLGVEQCVQLSAQFLHADRFCNVLVHARIQEPVSIAFQRMRFHGDDGNVIASLLFFCANCGSGRQSIHLGHCSIHENQVERTGFERSNRFDTDICNLHFVAGSLQQPNGQSLIHDAVFNK